MLAKVLSGAILGIDAYVVEVEVDIAQGLPVFATVGLPDGAVKEAKERVKSAIKNSGYEFPPKRLTIGQPPAESLIERVCISCRCRLIHQPKQIALKPYRLAT